MLRAPATTYLKTLRCRFKIVTSEATQYFRPVCRTSGSAIRERQNVAMFGIADGASFRRRGRRFCNSAQLGGLHERRAAFVVVILDLTIETLEALGRFDFAGLFDRPHRARAFAQMARTAAFGPALEQIEEMQPVQESQHATERTEEATIGPFGEQPDGEQGTGIEHKRPGAGEFRDDRGLERFDLGG